MTIFYAMRRLILCIESVRREFMQIGKHWFLSKDIFNLSMAFFCLTFSH